MSGAREFIEQMGIPILDVTDDDGRLRGEEIQRWLDAHPGIEQYVIVDDDSDMLDSQKEHFVNTDPEHGLTERMMYKVSRRFGFEGGY